MEVAAINKTFVSALPQDGLLACRIRCPSGAAVERTVFLERFTSLESRHLYVSAKGLDDGGEILLSIHDMSTGRLLLPSADIRAFAFSDIDNFRHCFRDSSGVKFTVENRSGRDAVVDITIIGQRFFSGTARNDFIQVSEGGGAAEPEKPIEIVEYDWVSKPFSFRFVSQLKDGAFSFDAGDDCASGEQAAYPLVNRCWYKLTEISVYSSLPEEVFAGAIHERFRFSMRTSRKQSFMALPFGFSSHIHRSEVESFLQNAHSSEPCELIGNLHGSLEQTNELIRLGSKKVAIVVNCMIYEGREHGR